MWSGPLCLPVTFENSNRSAVATALKARQEQARDTAKAKVPFLPCAMPPWEPLHPRTRRSAMARYRPPATSKTLLPIVHAAMSRRRTAEERPKRGSGNAKRAARPTSGRAVGIPCWRLRGQHQSDSSCSTDYGGGLRPQLVSIRLENGLSARAGGGWRRGTATLELQSHRWPCPRTSPFAFACLRVHGHCPPCHLPLSCCAIQLVH